MIICVLTPVFRIDQYAGKFELMNNLSSSGFSGVIFRHYKRKSVYALTRGPYERIVMNAGLRPQTDTGIKLPGLEMFL